MPIITIASAKGGAGKTTLAVGLFLAARATNHHTAILIDADRGGSACSWLPGHPDVHAATSTTELNKLLRPAGDQLIFVDTPPLYENSRMVSALLRQSSAAVIPVQPTKLGVERLPDLLAVMPSGLPFISVPSMLRASTAASSALRPELLEAGIPVSRNMIPLRESIAQLPEKKELGAWEPLFLDLLSEVLAITSTSKGVTA